MIQFPHFFKNHETSQKPLSLTHHFYPNKCDPEKRAHLFAFVDLWSFIRARATSYGCSPFTMPGDFCDQQTLFGGLCFG
jgi:hypothetical protein